MRGSSSSIKSIDRLTAMLYLILVCFGWLNIFAANTDPDGGFVFDLSLEYMKQLMWIGISFVTIGLLMLIDSKFFTAFAFIFYAITILMLILVIFLGVEVNSAHSWFRIGSFSFQPVELAKVATALTIGKILSRFQFSFTRIQDLVVLVTVWLLPVAIIILQNDMGSALVFFSLLIVFFREGMTPLILFFGIMAIVIFILTLLISNLYIELLLVAVFFILLFLRKQRKLALISLGIAALCYGICQLVFHLTGGIDHFKAILAGMSAASLYLISVTVLRRYKAVVSSLILFWGSLAFAYSSDYIFEKMLSDYQKSRILVMLGLKQDPLGAGYNVNQSKIAIGSGGFSGKGFLQGTQTKFNFVPEQSTDFIFCTVGEEWGFLGTSAVIILFVCLLLRLVVLAERQHSAFSRVYGYAVASIFFFHLLVNIGMTIGLAPVIGIPLPFFSYGGSSLWGFSILLFIFLKLDTNRTELLR
ncbi:rod shape-determining protein RodA [Xiashengella succiniciproducens]|uniref:Cell wall polymerase n=1 Tax=Xiashengella succiniciproducens TaxID=2949635 RepID=A0A9J6ZQT5_9BACT|nr:rod shape-determining protein RodA [Alkaliflexus sp. Ai-910]URW79975.1 rod shape-determining protein RodA [Alkaliflexus sp. Ai-910]